MIFSESIRFRGWLVSLDLNGCWNSNCDDIIFINRDTTNSIRTVLQDEFHLKMYPNPTSEILMVESDNFSINSINQYLQVITMDGKVLLKKEIKSPKTILNFRGMVPGVYAINIISKGIVLKSGKLVIQ